MGSNPTPPVLPSIHHQLEDYEKYLQGRVKKATAKGYHTRDILHVKWMSGHKRIENTLVYTHLVDFQSDEFFVRVAKTVDEVCQLIEAGFKYVTEIDSGKLFKKRK